MRAAVIGAGSWGTALAILLGRNGHDVVLAGRDDAERAIMASTRENHRYLPGFTIPDSVEFATITDSFDVDLAVLAVPAGAVLDTLDATGVRSPILTLASKGLEANSGRLMTEVAAERSQATLTVLTGPNLAIEIARGIPTVAVSASTSHDAAVTVRDAFSSLAFRVSTTDDVVGVELAGALKNVLAIGAGMSDGLGFGDNTKGALLSRGLMEMSRLGLAMGARMETFLGPAGVGDLFATAVSKLSRNYRCGLALGQGLSLTDALASLGQVAEGVPTAHATQALAQRHAVDMPVFRAVDAVIQGYVTPVAAVGMLMDRGTNGG